jgi:8-oxo-dGTP diphosphatase
VKTLEVVAAVFIADGKVLTCRRSPGRASEGRWEFPGGKVEAGEDPASALEREISEELGVNLVVGALLDRTLTQVGDLGIDLLCFAVTSFSPMPAASTDHDELRWVTAREADELNWAEPDLPMVRLLPEVLAVA